MPRYEFEGGDLCRMLIAVPYNKKHAEAILRAKEHILSYQNLLGQAQRHAQTALCIMTSAGINPQKALRILNGKCRVAAPVEIGPREDASKDGFPFELVKAGPDEFEGDDLDQ